MGFDHWYGFQGADSSQWQPGLWSDTTPVEPPHTAGYHLTTDMADHAVRFLETQTGSDQPFFLYFATGAGHAPHHAPREYIEANHGRLDEGWDVLRERTFAKQKEIGIIPQDTVLPERNPDIAAWDSLSADEKRLFTRMQEIHSGFIEHTDHEIGRVLDALERSGKLDDTLIILTSDNGTSGEGGPVGSLNEMRLANNVSENLQENLAAIDELGGPRFYNHYPAGWAQAGNTPFRYWKQETHEGGVHDPMIVSWPARIRDGGSIRRQFEHVVDVTPTVLQATGIDAPATLGGVAQMPMEGTSMLATFASADAPTAKTVQYFEMLGNRGLWKNGWKAVAFHGRLPWLQGVLSLHSFDDDRWELYHVDADASEAHDVAALFPEVLAALKADFQQQAVAHHVLPLDDSGLATRAAAQNAALIMGLASFHYDGPQIRIPESRAPWLKKRSYAITADLTVPEGGGNGVIVAAGGRYGGYALYLDHGYVTYAHNYVGAQTYSLRASQALPTGAARIRFEFERAVEGDNDTRGIGRIFIGDEKVAEGVIERTTPYLYGISDPFDVGSDTVTPVTSAYESPNSFDGTITGVSYDIDTASSGDDPVVPTVTD
jgi:arylsulfatase